MTKNEQKEHKQRSAQGDAFHKKNWREVRATEEDIQNFLVGTIFLRMNEVSGEAEFRVPSIGEYAAMGGQLTYQLTMNKLGRTMSALGFVSMRSRGERGYNVVAYSGADIDLNRTLMAQEAKPEDEVSVVSGETIFDTFDALF